jgi:hypothetical protein
MHYLRRWPVFSEFKTANRFQASAVHGFTPVGAIFLHLWRADDMGMDVSGRNPTAPEGEYFRASIWEWPLLVKVITTLCPQETSACKAWEFNDGDGLNAEQALALTQALERKLRSGEVAFALFDPAIISNAKSRVAASIEALFRSHGIEMLHDETIIDENFVAKFAAFVRASGGFAIW